MRAAKFLKCEPCGTSGNTERGKITAVSQILEVKGEQAIEISLFHKGVLKGRYFANEDGYNAWINGTWRICKLNNAARVCMGKEPVKSYYCDLDDCIAWESIEDKQRALDFLDTWRIGVYEDEINEANRQKAMERKVDRINDMMAEIPCVPDKVEDWLDQKIFPGHILFIKKVGKRTTYSCTACGCSSWKKKGWKHGEKTSCPKCGQLVTANSRQQEKVRKAPVILLQQYGEKWVERQFKTICRWSAGKKEIQMFEEIRAIIPKGKDWGKVWYGTRIEADEFEQDFWDRNQQNKRFVPSYLYPDNLKEVLPCGNLERSGIDALANSGTKFNVNKFITSFRARPYFEYIAKAGLYRLIADQMTMDIFGASAAGTDTWRNYFGGPEEQDVVEQPEKEDVPEEHPEPINENTEQEAEESQQGEEGTGGYGTDSETEHQEDDTEGEETGSGDYEEDTDESIEPAGEESQREEIAPAQKELEIQENECLESSAPEENDDENEPVEEEIPEVEVVDEMYETRREYMSNLTVLELAHYLAGELEKHHLEKIDTETEVRIHDWLSEKVDRFGKPMEDAR